MSSLFVSKSLQEKARELRSVVAPVHRIRGRVETKGFRIRVGDDGVEGVAVYAAIGRDGTIIGRIANDLLVLQKRVAAVAFHAAAIRAVG